METMNNYNGTILIVDLESRECETEELSEALIEKGLGGAAINLALYEQYRDRDPLVLGSGFFTATFMPLACCGVMTGKSPITGSVCHVPFGWQAGVELKLTGFDFVVILGKADGPVRLWLHDGLSDINDSGDVWGCDTWDSTDKIREAYGDDMVQLLLIGPAGENKVSLAQVSENYWGGRDRFGLGAVFGEKNLKAVAMRGLGALEVAEGFFQKCMALKSEIISGTIRGKTGLKDIAVDLGIDAGAIEKLSSLTHRNNAAFNCQYPYYTFLKYNEAPDAMAMTGADEPGCLVFDLAGFAALHAAGFDAARALEKCNRLGLEPVGACKGASDLGGLEKLAADGKADGVAGWPLNGAAAAGSLFSSAIPPRGIFADQGQGPEWWARKQALAYILGLDPVIILMAPEITEEKIVELVKVSAEWEEFSAEDLQRITSALIGG